MEHTPSRTTETTKRLTLSKAAIRAGLSVGALSRAIGRGDLPAIQPGLRVIFVRPEDVDEWLERVRIEPKPTPRERAAALLNEHAPGI